MLKYLFRVIFSIIIFSRGELIVFMLFIIFFFILGRIEGNLLFLDKLFEVDLISFSFIFLRFWVILLCYLSSIFLRERHSWGVFSFLFIFLIFFLFTRFSLNSYLLFYLRFEICLIPILFLILG